MRIRGRSASLVAGGLTTVLALSACGSGSGSSSQAGSGGDGGTLTLYNAQHEDLMKLDGGRLHQADRHQGQHAQR